MPRPVSPPQQAQIPNVGNVLADLNPDLLPQSQKREGEDWFAVFNPNVRRVLDVNLVHNLPHESVVCCVRFSADGKYVATGCNRSAQIFDVTTGRQVQCLQDDSVDKDGDLYIRSVCFSPDGKYLATGAEDKQIRVSQPYIHDMIICLLRLRYGTLPQRPSSTSLAGMSRIFILLTSLEMVN
jgi:glucose repression regulatory protein TUP1